MLSVARLVSTPAPAPARPRSSATHPGEKNPSSLFHGIRLLRILFGTFRRSSAVDRFEKALAAPAVLLYKAVVLEATPGMPSGGRPRAVPPRKRARTESSRGPRRACLSGPDGEPRRHHLVGRRGASLSFKDRRARGEAKSWTD